MGGAYASGTPVKDLQALRLPNTLDPWGSWLVTPRQRSAALEQFVASQLAHRRLEDFPVRFVAVATERQSGCVMLFGSGDAARAILASSALPGALAPVAINGGVYVDGGLSAPLPVRIARALGADVVIAVDTTFHAAPVVPDGLVDSVFHAGMVMARNLAAADRLAADLVLDPMFPPVPEVTLRNSKRMVDAGELAALQQLAQLRILLAPGHRAPKRPIGWEVAPVPIICSPAAGATPQGWQLSAQLQ
jgi:NTE family protein